MIITYKSICDKLGFNPMEYEPKVSSFEDDSKESPFSILTLEESDFLCDYLIKKSEI
jgi:hypothetical protein